MRYERFPFYTIVLMVVACSPETPAPPPPPPVATTSTAAPVPIPPIAKTTGSYDEAMLWLQSAPAFHFVLDEAGVHAEGDLTRRRVGAESVQFRTNGDEWRASAGGRGVAWERRQGSAWTAAAAPPFGNRVYQRVTIAFDPKKKEGAPQLVGTEGGASHYRFTNANTGEAHDVWVSDADSRLERVKIGDAFEMRISVR